MEHPTVPLKAANTPKHAHRYEADELPLRSNGTQDKDCCPDYQPSPIGFHGKLRPVPGSASFTLARTSGR